MKRKLIEVALPLEAINVASAREKSIRHGHPSTLHLWWARRPLAACRAVIFASLVDDPSSDPERFPTPKAQEDERTRLFGVIERLVKWESTTDQSVLDEARVEILRSTAGKPPPILDPFSGGGSIPLEAQRLGLTTHASDLNPVAVLITKAVIEVPSRFADRPPVHPDARRGIGGSGAWRGPAGLAEDVRRYGASMRDEAERRIGHLYPRARLPKEHGGGLATVIAWLWARTVACPNPACGAQMPLVRSFALSTQRGKEAWAQPVVDRSTKTVEFELRRGTGGLTEGTVGRQGARCIVCETSVGLEHIRSEGRAARMGTQLMAIVAEGPRGRVLLPPDAEHVAVADSADPAWAPSGDLATHPQYMAAPRYGLTRFQDLFTKRQLCALTTFSDLVEETRQRVVADGLAVGLEDDGTRGNDRGTGAIGRADAVALYLAFAVDKAANLWSSLASWMSDRGAFRETFARQALPMVWDFAEANPFSESGGSFGLFLDRVSDAVDWLPALPGSTADQEDASTTTYTAGHWLVVTDPPYYDNVPYADLSDFFYVWLKRSLKDAYPDALSTLLTPKVAELVADSTRYGGRVAARNHFETGLAQAFRRIYEASSPDYPTSIIYAFKQTEGEDDSSGGTSVASTGWETMLEALLGAGFAIDGTWPMRTEGAGRIRALSSNALSSSVVLVCRPRRPDAGVTTRADFVAALRRELPAALRTLQHGNIAPVDLAQASIGPGMAIFSRYLKILEADGSPVMIRSALALINQVLDEVVSEQEGEFDSQTRFAITWYSQHGFGEGTFGEADVLARARDTSVSGLEASGILRAGAGKVRLLSRDGLDAAWDPATDRRPTVWEATQHLVRRLFDEGSEESAADLLARIGGLGETARDLAYRLYLLCERKGWTDEARAYNGLVVSWPEISRQALSRRSDGPSQQSLDLGG